MGIINQRNASNLLFSLRSPVFEKLDDLGQELVDAARDEAAEYLRDYRGNLDLVLECIDYEIIQAGFLLELRVGIKDDGYIARSIAIKDEREHRIMQPALDRVMG